MNMYYIEVEAEAEFTRTFRISAKDEWAALAAYQADSDDVVWVKDDNEDIFECQENGDTALVLSEDGTVLIDVADML